MVPEGLAPIGLDELMDHAALLDRVDAKYVVPLDTLARLLEALGGTHRLLTVEGRTSFAYRSTYYDTPRLTSFREHAQRRRRRFKCRTRLYVDAGLHAFEVKLKGLRGRTVKHRLTCAPLADGPLGDPAREFLDGCLHDAYGRRVDGDLAPVLTVDYRRVTLAATGSGERLTYDLDLGFAGAAGRGRLREGLAIVESKSAGGGAVADRILRGLGARPLSSCSKYCLGIGLTRPDASANSFRPLLRRYFEGD